MNKQRLYFLSLVGLTCLALAATIAYFVGKGQSESALTAMKAEVEALKAGEREAAVVKRVSQQMEEIAYQQKEISDRQRDKAEESSRLAIQMRDRAEQESRSAHEAEGKAVKALEEAKTQRAYAEEQQKIAVEERDRATLSKTIADTLTYRTQAKTLGLTSRNQRETGDTILADLLAYASWYFLDKYKGNTYYTETFRALSMATAASKSYFMERRGAVNALSIVPPEAGQKGKDGCVAASNYGELEICWSAGGKTPLLHDNTYDFRDVWAGKQAVYALSKEGTLCVVNYNAQMQRAVTLPPDNFFKMIRTDSNTLLLAARQSLCWYTFSSGAVSAPVRLQKTLSAICKREHTLCLFFADGSYAEMDGTGKLTEKTPLVKRVVTAAHYAPDLQCLFLGLKEGPVQLVNKYNRQVEILEAHKAKPISITTVGPIMVSGAYDKAIYIWKLDNLLFNTGLNFWQEMETAKTQKRTTAQPQNRVPGEWLSPVEYIYRSWTLSTLGDPRTGCVWIGTATGEVVRQNVSVDNMAQQVHNKLKRNFTDVEWSRFMGASIPYVQFKE
ncbi:MAG: hypothetical protein IJV06_03910 [Bacteroidaceae bacterium]|nr:hypothetical protein [Bacteroidaceae bacterium]